MSSTTTTAAAAADGGSAHLLHLPFDLTLTILRRLPTKHLLNLLPVSAAFPPLISHPDFLRHHFSAAAAAVETPQLIIYYESQDYTSHHYSLRSLTTLTETRKLENPVKSLHGYLRVAGSEKGLMCFFDTNFYSQIGRVIFWNPCISKIKYVKDLSLGGVGDEGYRYRYRDCFSHTVVGFGFVNKEMEFKVVLIMYNLDEGEGEDVLVYALREDRWRKKEGVVVPCFVPKCWASSVYVRECVHWLGFKKPKKGSLFDSVMVFDMVEERFRVLEFPKNVVNGYDQMCLLSSQGGDKLLMCFDYVVMDGYRWDVWVMDEYGVVDSWKLMFSIVNVLASTPLLSIGDGFEVLFVLNNGMFVLYNARTGIYKDLDVNGLPSSFRAVGYTSSLALMLEGK